MTRRDEAQELVESLPDDLDVTVDEVEDSLDQLVNEFGVPIDEAIRSTRNKYTDEYDGEVDTRDSPSNAQDEDYDLGDLTVDQDEDWMNIRGTVQQLFSLSESQSEWIAQRGVLGDDTGTTVFTVPKDAVEEDPDLKLEEGETYELESVVGDAYDGDLSVKITKNTSVTALDESYTPPDNDTTITGCIVDIQMDSGLIKRCPEDDCTYIVKDGRCAVHGEVDGDFDLRLKTVVDDGVKAHEVYFGQEATEALTGISMEDAIEIANDAVQIEAVMNEMEPMLVGRYYTVAGNEVGDYVIVNEFERVQRDWQTDAESVLDSLAGNDEVEA